MQNLANIIFDVSLGIILLVGLLIGYKKGFINIVFKTFRSLGALILAYYLAKPFVAMFDLTNKIAQPVKNMLLDYVVTGSPEGTAGKIPTVLKSLANLFGTDLTKIANSTSGEVDYADAFATAAAQPVAEALATVGCFIAVYILGYIAIFLVGKFVNVVFKLPVLKQINAIVGACFGVLFFAVLVLVLCKVSVFVFELFPHAAFLKDFDIEKTYIGKLFYEFDVMKALLSF